MLLRGLGSLRGVTSGEAPREGAGEEAGELAAEVTAGEGQLGGHVAGGGEAPLTGVGAHQPIAVPAEGTPVTARAHPRSPS